MANPSDLSVRLTDRAGTGVQGELDILRQEFNKLVVNLRVLTAKMDADAGITDSNYGTLVTDTAASGPAKVVAAVG